MLALELFTVRLGGRPFVGPITLRLGEGEFLAVTGPNGSGKSTFLRGLLGLLPTGGTLRYQSQPVSRLPAADVGYVPQRFHFPGTLPLTVREFLGADSAGPSKALCSELRINRLLDRSLAVLSGGELQRVILARALARHPKLLVLDEASAGIDALGRSEITDLLLHLLTKHQVTIITVTHDPSEVRHYRTRLGARFHGLTLAADSH